MLELILRRENMTLAYKRVKGNGGSPGVDGMRVDELQPYLGLANKVVIMLIINLIN